MQLSTYGNAAQVSGVEHTQAFQMQMNSKMFSILTDKLYQNKEGAVIRELSANARDAHVEAGKPDLPFELTLPTWLSDEFKIRDFGTGIDPKKFYDIYTNLGESTKDNDNTTIGAYGLGSKTPFAITDSYTIRNFWNGTVYVYAAFKDAGMPTVSLLGSEATTEANGLEISVDVSNSGNKSSFVKECAKQLAYFEVKPTIVNMDDFEWHSVVDLSQGYHLKTRYYNQQITIVMGGIPYVASSDDLYDKTRDLLRRTEVVLVAELGEVDIPPSRESLELTTKTLQFIEAKVAKIKDDYHTLFSESIKKSKNSLELYVAYSARNVDWVHHSSFNQGTYEYKGVKHLGSELEKLFEEVVPDAICKENTRHYKTLRNFSRAGVHYLFRSMSDRNHEPKASWKVYLNDISPRATRLINEQKDILLSQVPVVFSTERKIINFPAAVDKLEIDLKALGLSVERLSTLITVPVVVKGSKVAAYNKPDQIFKVDHRGSVCKYAKLTELPDSGYYVPMSNWTPTKSSSYLAFIVEELGHPVYALRSDAVKSVVKSGTMTCVSELEGEIIKSLKILLAARDKAIVNLSVMTNLLGVGNSMFYADNLDTVKAVADDNQVKVLMTACVALYKANEDSQLSRTNETLVNDLAVLQSDTTPAHSLSKELVASATYASKTYVKILDHTLSTTRSWSSSKSHVPELLNLITGTIK